MKLKKLAIPVLLIIVLIISFGCAKPSKKPGAQGKAARPEVGGFAMNQPGPTDSLPSLKAHADLIDEFYPLWYHVKADGSLKEEPNPDAIAFAKTKKIKIFPLINVVPSQDSVLLNPAARDNAISNIIRIVKQNDYDGVNIDFEFIPTSGKTDFSVDRDKMTNFMKLLHDKLHAMGKETHMAVLPHVGVPQEMSGIYDYAGLAPFIDKVTIMCYDHSQAGSQPGAVAPFSWVESNVKVSIKQGFKPSQICLGVANYGYDWPAGKTGGFSSPSRQILKDAAMKGFDIKWSEKYQEPYYVYTDPSTGVKREVWFENANTLRQKMRLVRKYKLSGICIWRLGFEDQKFWDVISKDWGKRRP